MPLLAAKQLAKSQLTIKKKGYLLKVYDCYRPQRAVNEFYQWIQQKENNHPLKVAFYPREQKGNEPYPKLILTFQ